LLRHYLAKEDQVPTEINVAVIGLGGKGRSHALNLARLPGVRIAALCDVSSAAIAHCRNELGDAATRAYDTTDAVRAFADPNVDAVVIATQHDTHEPLAVAAAEAKKHLLVEKPLALTVGACQAIEDAVDRNGVQLLMGFQARYRHFTQLIRQRIPRPRIVIGKIIDPKWPDSFWAVDPVKGGGNVLSQGVHAFDLVSYLAGAEPVRIFAMGGIFSHDPAVTPTIDTCVATIHYANGTIGSVTIGDFGPLPWDGDKSFYQVFDARDRSATMYGTKVLFASGGFSDRREVEELDTTMPSDGEKPDYDGTVDLVAEFIACARENRPPAVGATARDGRRATTLVLRAFDAMQTGLSQDLVSAPVRGLG
jgi:predicted dehydrogenase